LTFAEMTSGDLLPDYGNRTAAVVDAITCSGFDEGEHGRIETSGGNLGREFQRLACLFETAGMPIYFVGCFGV
jgi:hypothetical protein